MIGVYRYASEIDWESLPNSFVLKWNFGATMNLICSDKRNLNITNAKNQLEKWGRNRYWLPHSEMQYKKIEKKIVCEEFLTCSESLDLPDYKFFCFNGEPKLVMVCLDRTNNNESVHAKYIFFDLDWNILPFSEYAINHFDEIHILKPEGFNMAVECARKLATPFPFVRTDLYIVDGKPFFGELTFTPCGGLDTDLFDGDRIMGEMLSIAD